MQNLTAKAHAKLNLFLHVTGKREDGYHNLHSLTAFLDLADIITFSPKQENSPKIEMTGAFCKNLKHVESTENLAMQAATNLASHADQDFNFDIHIEKNIPPGAGLGGGSADAAATIRALIDHWELNLPETQLQQVLLNLGADVPACFKQQTLFMSGIGDVIDDGPSLLKLNMILIYPGISSDTAKVYKNLKNINHEDILTCPDQTEDQNQFINFLLETRNDLTEPACKQYPEIRTALDYLDTQKGIRLARMTGSGSACFGIFDTAQNVENAVKDVRTKHPDWWCQKVSLLEKQTFTAP